MTEDIIIFTDLDGTLLDYHSYSFNAALPALNIIKDRQIPLILVSSKTRKEMVYYQNLIGLTGLPFVVENGSAVCTPLNYFNPGAIKDKPVRGKYDCYVLGSPYADIRSILDEISKKHDYLIRGFHNLSPEEIQHLTGLNDEELNMSLSRDYSIPLLFDKKAEEILVQELNRFDLGLLRGGRFMHLMGKTDKGQAMKLIMQGYREKFKAVNIKAIALGDSLNDVAMLQEADYPVLVKKYNDDWQDALTINNLIYSPGIGPVGWNTSVINLLTRGGSYE